ncbi:MAG: hypothetical protein LBN36_07270 [Clostridiales Family XIII bacterium]|jgi:hypothetical protein|nr:hypothetical protein [Clostridiales Family XIII bacterium]
MTINLSKNILYQKRTPRWVVIVLLFLASLLPAADFAHTELLLGDVTSQTEYNATVFQLYEASLSHTDAASTSDLQGIPFCTRPTHSYISYGIVTRNNFSLRLNGPNKPEPALSSHCRIIPDRIDTLDDPFQLPDLMGAQKNIYHFLC